MTTFHCKIGGTDFGPAGNAALVGVTLTPSGPGKIGACKLTLQKAGGGYTFANMIEVQLYETDSTANVVWRWFGGFVTRVTTRRIAYTNLKIYELDCQDYNLLLQTLVCDAKTTLVLGPDTAVNQIADLFTQLTSGASKGIDATSGVADLLPAVTLPDVHARGKTAAVILDRIFTNVRLQDSTIRPAAFLGLDSTIGIRGNFGLPTLQVYDRAAPPSATVTLTDENSTIRQQGGFVRTLDAAKLTTWRQVIVDQTGGVHDAPDATAAALYPNPFDPDGYWRDVPLEDKDSATDADAIALATTAVQKVSNPRETIQLTTTERVRPGDFVSVTWTLEGLADQVYEVVETNVEFEAKDPARPVYHLTLGARKRSLGETDDDSISVPPVIYDHVPPDQPATPTYTTTYDRASNTSTVVISWAANTEDDLDHYLLRLARGAAYSIWIVVAAMGSPQYTYTTTPGETFTASVQALDTSGNTSTASATLSGTAHAAVAESPGPPATVTVTSTRTGVNQARGDVSWSVGTGGTGTPTQYDVRYYVTASGATTATIMRCPNDTRQMTIPGLVVGTGYTFNVRSITAYGDAGAWSTGATVTAGVESPGAPATVTVTGTRTGPATGQANLSWTAGTGGTGTPTRYEARYYVTASGASTATIIPIANDNRVLIIPGLAVGTGYTFNVRSITAYGDAGPWSSSAPTLTLAAQAPPAPTSLTVLDYDPGQTGQSAWILLGWTAGVGGTGTVATYNVRVDWTETSTGVVRKWHRDGIPATDTSTILSPLTAGPSYTITLWGITAWGDSSSPASTTYGITPKPVAVLYNGDFEIADPSNLARPDGWTVTLGGGHTAALDTAQASSGLQSVKITAGASTGNTTTLTSRKFRIPANVQFVLRYTRRSDEASPTSTVGGSVDYYNLAGSLVSSQAIIGTAPAAGSTWETAIIGVGSGSLTTPVAYAQISLAVTMAQASKHLWLDAVTFTQRVVTDDYTDASVTTAKFAAGSVDSTALGTAAITSITKFSSALAPIQKGTSNPGSPSSNDRNWRTDIGRDAYYDGTRWVTPDVKMLPFEAPNALTATTTTGANVGRLTHNGDLDWLLYRFAAAVFVGGTSDISNYWTLQLRYITAGNTITNVASMTTAAVAGNVWNRIATTTFSPATAPATAFMLEIIATKTAGAPGSLLVIPQLLIREIMP